MRSYPLSVLRSLWTRRHTEGCRGDGDFGGPSLRHLSLRHLDLLSFGCIINCIREADIKAQLWKEEKEDGSWMARKCEAVKSLGK